MAHLEHVSQGNDLLGPHRRPSVTVMSAELEITDALLSYCRGIDRLDRGALLAAFHPGAMLLDYGPDPLPIEAFADHALGSLEKRFTATQHRMSNTAIEIEGEQALVETYVLAFHLEASDTPEGADRLHTFNGRYIDRFEWRRGPWLIAERTLRVDWTRIETVDETMGGSWIASGRAGSPDPLYS